MQKRKTFRPWQPEQTSLLPASPSDWLTADHQVYFLLDLVDELDLSAIVIPAQSKDPRGEKGFDPRMMTLLLLYAYCVGTVSSRKIERACYEDLAFRVLTGNQQPDHSRISEFRRRNLEALSELFVQILRLCQAAGMVSLGHVALDGTKVQANASKHKAMSHERMLKAEAQLEKEIKELMRRAEILDAQEDGKYGKGKLGSDLPKELRRREDRLKKIRHARQALEAEAAAAAARDRAKQAAEAEAAVADAAAAADAAVADASEQQKLAGKAAKAQEKAEAAKELAIEKAQEAGLEPEGLDPQPADAMPYRGLAHRADGSPTAAAQRNYTDPDSHIMKSDGNLLQGYNCQAAVDGDHQVIVAMGVSNQPPDPEHLVPMLERTMANTTQVPRTFIADAGYWSEDNVSACEKRGTDPHIATGRLPHGQPLPPIYGPIPKGLDAKGKMARKLRKKEGREIYAKRKTIVEPVFGQTKEVRGLRRFLLRGLAKVNGEWMLWGTTHNLNKLWRHLKKQRLQEAMATG
ncbi:IS1182 family transposase [Synechococcus sp. CBW1108]|uniref:IS1182 family transposase n=1 Tax=Synechococcus sp. CBW1108 TaxID=1353147 RepID=UPI0018CED0B1|nr:IS1182 family transposase [Synechococcus sp. CBW1108]QPN69365.1 IS1182 family transposase [Synechococcus sp. CBW1108]QPN69520.1 IS1182 family transposase [Synechococcus sp. CBW1108]QPN69527.1 IS1182 family transposase [Synechococcus sp. CBW1108]QPN69730.1 IS1182 family transposase [Synechococcus sp. CBW1108]QPN69876.1 IS1182 family transposase [Synechococcus sp. CBW1108]